LFGFKGLHYVTFKFLAIVFGGTAAHFLNGDTLQKCTIHWLKKISFFFPKIVLLAGADKFVGCW